MTGRPKPTDHAMHGKPRQQKAPGCGCTPGPSFTLSNSPESATTRESGEPELLLRLHRKDAEGRRILHGQIGERLSVQLDPRLPQTIHQP